MKDLYKQYKRLLFTLAYQLTGSTVDAEDTVHDVFIKVHDVDPGRLKEPKAYLCKMVTNRCLDVLKSARQRREKYFGPWLPEPLLTSAEDSIEPVISNDLLSYAMLVLLERLTPAERAVFVLREALCFDYADIAELLEKREANCRKLMSRAKAKMGISEHESVNPEPATEEWIRQFLKALEQGNVEKVLSLLSEDVTLVSDGGGKAIAAAHPIQTRDRVAKFLLGGFRNMPQFEGGVHIELTSINGQTGFVFRSVEGVVGTGLMYVEHGILKHIYIVRNPDKLTRI